MTAQAPTATRTPTWDAVSARETELAEPTPTPGPYFPIFATTEPPEGGWVTYRDESLGLSFEYPAVYDLAQCGNITAELGRSGLVIYPNRGSFYIFITEQWGGDLHAHVLEEMTRGAGPGGIQPLTIAEPYSLDGAPAYRFILRYPRIAATYLSKHVFAEHNSNLYEIRYSDDPFSGCDSPPISDEAVFEHVVLTWQFE
jgi:hypothetical protein